MKKRRLTLLTLLMLSIFFLIPTQLYAKFLSANIDGAKIYYHQTGQGNRVLLLLHGFMANGDQWSRISLSLIKEPNFNKHYTIIAPDLPGFGRSTGYPFAAYRPTATQGLSQVTLLYKLLIQLHLAHRPIDVAGNSLGGLLATILTEKYASHAPHRLNIQSLAFIGSPSGIEPLSPAVVKTLESGFNPFIPTTRHEFTQEVQLLIHNAPEVLRHVSPKTIKAIVAHNQKYYKTYAVISALLSMPPYLTYIRNNQQVKALKQPVAIFWGSDDQIFSEKTGLPLLEKAFSHVKIAEVVPNAGHVIMLESDRAINKVASAYYTFLLSQPAPKNK